MTAGVIEGELTRLIPVEEGDLDLLAEWFADPEFVEHWGGSPLTREEVASKYLGRRRPRVESFLIHAAEGPVGYAQYVSEAGNSGGIDMVLSPASRGKGLGPDAAQALARHVLEGLAWSRVTVDPEAANHRAIRAWEKAGFLEVESRGDHLLMERRAH